MIGTCRDSLALAPVVQSANSTQIVIIVDLIASGSSKHILNRRTYDIRMLRLLATLTFAASFDIILFDGRYITAVDKVAVAIFRSF